MKYPVWVPILYVYPTLTGELGGGGGEKAAAPHGESNFYIGVTSNNSIIV